MRVEISWLIPVQDVSGTVGTIVPCAEGTKATVFIPLQWQHQDMFLRVAGKVDTDTLSTARSALCSHPCNTPSVEGSVAKDVRHLIRDVCKCEKHCLLKIFMYLSWSFRGQSHSANSGNVDQDGRKARSPSCRLQGSGAVRRAAGIRRADDDLRGAVEQTRR